MTALIHCEYHRKAAQYLEGCDLSAEELYSAVLRCLGPVAGLELYSAVLTLEPVPGLPERTGSGDVSWALKPEVSPDSQSVAGDEPGCPCPAEVLWLDSWSILEYILFPSRSVPRKLLIGCSCHAAVDSSDPSASADKAAHCDGCGVHGDTGACGHSRGIIEVQKG
jgi:hypothetical protein